MLSDFIQRLQQELERHGDLPVVIYVWNSRKDVEEACAPDFTFKHAVFDGVYNPLEVSSHLWLHAKE